MTLVTRLGNMFEKYRSNEVVSEYIESLGDDYPVFVNGELKITNENYNRKLGGQESKISLDEDDDDQVNMDKYMQKFSSFENLKQTDNNNDDDDEDEQVEEKIEAEGQQDEVVQGENAN